MKLTQRLNALDWPTLLQQLDTDGFALTGPLLSAAECEHLIGLYGEDERFRKRIDMARHRFGAGSYAYFAEPLPPIVQTLRETLYARLAPVANAWQARLGRAEAQGAASQRAVSLPTVSLPAVSLPAVSQHAVSPGAGFQHAVSHPAASQGGLPHGPAGRGAANGGAAYPATLAGFLRRCHGAGQRRPTPLLLRYEAGGYNCLHQDLYGAVAFPLQATCFLSRPGADYRGGEFLLLEQRPRQQSRGTALLPEQGALAIFPSAQRPVAGRRGFIRAGMRHGVSTVTAGLRYTLGIVFHDAQ